MYDRYYCFIHMFLTLPVFLVLEFQNFRIFTILQFSRQHLLKRLIPPWSRFLVRRRSTVNDPRIQDLRIQGPRKMMKHWPTRDWKPGHKITNKFTQVQLGYRLQATGYRRGGGGNRFPVLYFGGKFPAITLFRGFWLFFELIRTSKLA